MSGAPIVWPRSACFRFESQGKATMTLYNTLGESAGTLFDGDAVPGSLYKVRFDASGFASGVYFYRLTAGEYASVRRLLLIR